MKNIQLANIMNDAASPMATSGLRELSANEMTQVSGSRPEGYLNALVNRGLFSPVNIAKATRFAGGLGLIYSSFRVGWTFGTYIYNSSSNAYYGGGTPGK